MSPIPESEAYLDTRSGEVSAIVFGWSDDHALAEAELAEALASGRLVPIEPAPAGTVRGWMRDFVEGLEHGWARDVLRKALAAEAPVRRFEDALGRFPEERVAWLTRRRACVRALVTAWLQANEIEATNQPEALGRF